MHFKNKEASNAEFNNKLGRRLNQIGKEINQKIDIMDFFFHRHAEESELIFILNIDCKA